MDEQRQQELEKRAQKLDDAVAGLATEQGQTLLGLVGDLHSLLADLPDDARESALSAIRALLGAWAPPLGERRPVAASVPQTEELRWVANRLRRLAPDRT